jgi:hypothetical protein
MRAKFAGLVGIFAVALALGLGATVDNGQADDTKGHSIQAEVRGPNAPTPAPGA